MILIVLIGNIGIHLFIRKFWVKIRKSLLSSLLIACAGRCIAAWMPQDTQWILDVDMQALNASRIGPLIVERMQREQPAVFEKVCGLATVTGINLHHALTALTVCGSGWNTSNVVSQIVGRNAFAQISRDRLGASLKVSAYGPYELFAWTRGALSMAVSQPEAGTLIVAEPARLKNALDVYAGRGKACDASRFQFVSGPRRNALARFEARDVAALFQQDQSPYGLVLRYFSTLDGCAVETDNQIRLTVRGLAATPEAAQEAAQLVRALVALSQMNAAKVSDLRSVLRALQIEQEGAQVRCHVALPVEQIKVLFKDERAETTHTARR